MKMQTDPDAVLYQALLDRDAGYEGRVWVGVTSTGVFCRLTCPARKPHRKNCVFYTELTACLAAGFRACKRCTPLAQAAAQTPLVRDVLAHWQAAPDEAWDEARLAGLGFDPSTVRRQFNRLFGVTFLQMVRQARLRTGASVQARGGRVIDAQLEAGFSSGGGFRRAFASWLGMAPGSFREGGLLRADWIDTPMGAMVAVSDAQHLHLLEFTERKALPGALRKLHQFAKGDLGFGRHPPTDQVAAEMAAFMAGQAADFTVPLALQGTPFTRQVWRALQDIPAGQTRSYAQVAQAIGRPSAVRAVARANGANPLAIVVPCHRVIGADGNLTGYGGGLWRKQRLLELEQHYAQEIT